MINWKRNLTLFLSGQALSMFGSMLVQYAIFWHITLATQSGAMMTVYVLVALLPIFFVSPFGGVLADRFNRRNLINLADGGIAAVTLLIALAFALGYRELWLIFLCASVRSIGQGVQSPAVTSFIPQITPAEHLSKINGINTSIQSGIAIAAPMVSGALLSFMSIEKLLFIDIITALIGISILQFLVKIPVPNRHSDESQNLLTEQGIASQARNDGNNYFRDLLEGLRYVWKTRFVFLLILLEVILFAALSPAAFLTPLQVAREFGSEYWKLTAVEIAFSGGMMLGGLIIGFWGGFSNKMHSLALSCVISGAGIVALGLLDNLWFYLTAMLVVGLSVPLSSTPCTTL
ncbi:MAG: MFS transporter, partial [Paludibacter sp.]|nr:MFS transporter [Paludibacter sp.]